MRNRGGIYVLLNACVLLGAAFGVMSGNAPASTATYACLLLILCSMPLLWLRRFNDRYALIAIFMSTYYLFFGALNLRNVLLGSDIVPAFGGDEMTTAQSAVLLGAVLVLVGYRFGSSLVRPVAEGAAGSDFSNAAVLAIGLGCWILGSTTMAYYSVVVVPENSLRATARGLANMGAVLTFAVMLGQLMQPLGVVMLSYGYAKNRTPFWLGLVVAMVVMQLLLGFVTDTKGTAVIGVLLVAITQTLWDNKLSKAWIAGVVAFAILVFPVMQAARVVRGERGLDRAQAFEHIPEMMERAWEARVRVNESDKPRERAQTFLERSSGEAALEPIFEHAGVDTPFLQGRSLMPVVFAFIPRLILPDKEGISLGQLYNHVFMHASIDDFTYISVSVLGEFYWNFGWPGIVCGMLLLGLVLGVAGAKSSLAEVHSLTRLLILLVSIMQLCLGFGGNTAVAWVLWLRAIAAIGLLHALFARRTAVTTVVESPETFPTNAPDALVKHDALVNQGAALLQARTAGLPLLPNMMR